MMVGVAVMPGTADVAKCLRSPKLGTVSWEVAPCFCSGTGETHEANWACYTSVHACRDYEYSQLSLDNAVGLAGMALAEGILSLADAKVRGGGSRATLSICGTSSLNS